METTQVSRLGKTWIVSLQLMKFEKYWISLSEQSKRNASAPWRDMTRQSYRALELLWSAFSENARVFSEIAKLYSEF